MSEALPLPIPEQGDALDTTQERLQDIENTVNDWLNEHSTESFSPEKLTALVEFIGARHNEDLKVLSADFDNKEIYPNRPAIQLFGEEGPESISLSLNGWRSGEKSSIHDHANTEGAYHVFEGELTNEQFRALNGVPVEKIKDQPDGVPIHKASHSFVEGKTIPIPASYIHRVVNYQDSITLTIHAYHPPLGNISYYNLENDRLTFIEDAQTRRARLGLNRK